MRVKVIEAKVLRSAHDDSFIPSLIVRMESSFRGGNAGRSSVVVGDYLSRGECGSDARRLVASIPHLRIEIWGTRLGGEPNRLLRRHADGGEPGFEELGPFADGEFGGAESEGMAALGVEMHLDGDAGVLERDVVDEGLIDAVDVVILILEDEGGRRLRGEMGADVGVEFRLTICLSPKERWPG